MNQLDTIGQAILALGFYLAAAIPVRRVGGRLLASAMPATSVRDWTFRTAVRHAYRSFERSGWSGRHGLPDALVSAVESGYVSTFELEQVACRPPIEDVGLADVELTEAEAADAAKMTELADEVRAEQAANERRAALVAALQENTALLPMVVIEQADAAARTRAAFAATDDFAAAFDLEFATALGVFLNDNAVLVAELGVARMYRGWVPSTTGEQPVVRVPRQRMAEVAS